MYIIINNQTKKAIRLICDLEERGVCYNSYQVKVFSIADHMYAEEESVVFVAESFEEASAILNGAGTGLISSPKMDTGMLGYVDGEKCSYSVVSLVL